MARFALPVASLTAVLAACGGTDSRAQTQSPEPRAPAPARAAIAVFTPAAGKVVEARPHGAGRLQAVVRVSGRAAPGQQLALVGTCGRASCDGITFADSDGRWRTRVGLVTPSRKRRTVRLRVSYADAAPGERPATVTVRLRKVSAPPQATPDPAPPASGGSNATGGQPAPATGGTTAPYTGPRTMIVIGDSLAVGMAPALRGLLPEWEIPVDGRTGRPLAEGMEILAETPRPAGARGERAILALSLGTNDGPSSADALEAAVRRSVAYLGPRGCALWATIARPPLNGVSYRAMNARLEALAAEPGLSGRLLIVPWKREYDRNKSWRRSDGVHATPEGYAGRARLYAQAASACPA